MVQKNTGKEWNKTFLNDGRFVESVSEGVGILLKKYFKTDM